MVDKSNPYKEKKADDQIVVQIRIFDILYDDQVCNLVYMEDMTSFYQSVQSEKAQQYFFKATQCITEELQTTLKSTESFPQELQKHCPESQSWMLKSLQFTSSQLALQISNLKEFQTLNKPMEDAAFTVQERPFNAS